MNFYEKLGDPITVIIRVNKEQEINATYTGLQEKNRYPAAVIAYTWESYMGETCDDAEIERKFSLYEVSDGLVRASTI